VQCFNGIFTPVSFGAGRKPTRPFPFGQTARNPLYAFRPETTRVCPEYSYLEFKGLETGEPGFPAMPDPPPCSKSLPKGGTRAEKDDYGVDIAG
jgi:hypothetical protein